MPSEGDAGVGDAFYQGMPQGMTPPGGMNGGMNFPGQMPGGRMPGPGGQFPGTQQRGPVMSPQRSGMVPLGNTMSPMRGMPQGPMQGGRMGMPQGPPQGMPMGGAPGLGGMNGPPRSMSGPGQLGYMMPQQPGMGMMNVGGMKQPQQPPQPPPPSSSDEFPSLGGDQFPSLGGRGPGQGMGVSMAGPGGMGAFGGIGGYGATSKKQQRSEFTLKAGDSEMFPALPGAKSPPGPAPPKSPGNGGYGELDDVQLGGPRGGPPRGDLSGTDSGGDAASSTAVDLCEGYGLVGLLKIIQMSEQDVKMLALGTDFTSLGLNLNSSDLLYPSFQSPWASAPLQAKEPPFQLPQCYSIKMQGLGSITHRLPSVSDESLFFVFYGMPGDVAQLAAAATLYERHWRYHKELKVWITRAPGVEPTQKTAAYERGTYIYFDINTWKKVTKEFTLQYDQLEERRTMPTPPG